MEALVSKIILLGQQNNFVELQSILKNVDIHNVYSQIEKLLPLQKFTTFLEYVLEGCNIDEDWAHIKKTKIIIHCLRQVQKRQLTQYTLQEEHIKLIIYRIFICINDTKFIPEHLVRICNLLIESVQKGNRNDTSWHDLLPAILKKMLVYEQVEYQDLLMTTDAYNMEIIKRLLQLEWSKDIIILLAEMFLKIPLPQSETQKVMNKLTNAFDSLNPDEIPPLVYHLLRLNTSDGSGLFIKLQQYYGLKIYERSTYVGSIYSESMDSNTNLYDITLKSVIDSESNTMYHILNSSSEKSVQQYFNYLTNLTKLPESILHPFNLSLLIASSIQLGNENSLQVIKTTILRYYAEDEKRNRSCYLRENVAQRFQLKDILLQIIEVSINNREMVLDGLVKLAFVFMNVVPQIGKEHLAIKMGKLGSYVLITIIEKKVDMIPIAIQRIIAALETQQNSFHIIECFATIVKKYTYATTQSISDVMNVFNDFKSISNYAASAFLDVIMQLVRFCPQIKEKVMMMLQDCRTCANKLETRINVVTAYVKLLKHLQITNTSNLSQHSSCSQFSASVSTQMMMSRTLSGTKCDFSNEAICMEAIDKLNRCFSLQVEIKQELYKGLPDVVRKNKELGIAILDLLWNVFKRIMEVDPESLPPINLKNICKITDTEAVLVEPIGQMIMAIALVLSQLKQHEITTGCVTEELSEYETSFHNMATRMGNTELERLTQKEDLDLSDVNSIESQEQLRTLYECMATYEAFITYYFLTWTNASENVGNTIKNLYKGYKRLSLYLKDHQKSKKVDKKNNTTTSQNASTAGSNVTRFIAPGAPKKLKIPTTILPLHCFKRIIELLYSDNVPWALNEEANILKGYVHFHHYVLEALISVALRLKQSKHLEHERKNYYSNNFDKIANILYTRCIKRYTDLTVFDSTTAVLTLEAYYAIQVFKQQMKEKWTDDTATNTSDNTENTNLFEDVLATYQHLFDGVDVDDDPDTARMTLALVNTLSLMSQQIPEDNLCLYNKFLDWMKTKCIEKKLTGKVATTNFICCLLNTSMRFQKTIVLWKMVIVALGAVLGWTSAEPPEIGDEMEIINASTAQAILQTVLNEFKTYLDDVDWIIARIKVEYNYVVHFKTGSLNNAHEQLLKKERNVCNKLIELVTVTYLCTNLSFESVAQAQTELMLKNNINLFNCLTNLGKYFLTSSTPDNLAFQQAHFHGLVRVVIKKLPVIYDQIKLIEQKQKSKQFRKHTEANAFKSTVLKDRRSITLLVYGIELFKKIVIQISKKTKVEVYGNLGIGTVRDYRVRNLKDAVGEQRFDEDDLESLQSDSASVSDVSDVARTPSLASRIIVPETDASDDEESSVSPPKRTKES